MSHGRWRMLAASLLLPAAAGLGACYSGVQDAELSGGVADGGDGADGDGDGDGGDGGAAEQCKGGENVGVTRLRRLTQTQYDNTVADLLGIGGNPSANFAPDERVGPFKSNSIAPVAELQVEQYMAAAESLADQAVQDLAGVLPCDASEGDTCAQQFIEEFGPRAYRRPLTDAEVSAMMAVYEGGKAQGDFTNGIRITIAAVLQSPYFLYHNEEGAEDGSDGSLVALTDYEVASRLSYFLWDTMPDNKLFAAAEAGELSTDEGLTTQIDRMLRNNKASQAIGSFHLQWLGVDEVDGLEKDPTAFPDFDADLAVAMREETAAFANFVISEGDGLLETLLTADFTVTEDPSLLALYGVELPANHTAGDPVSLDATQRAGLLTHPSMMAQHAHANQTSPVHRGVVVRQNFFCQILPPPPPEVDNVPPDLDPGLTTRERFQQHRADPSCAGCHSLIDELGFGFEHYDGVGKYRAKENGLDIDASGNLVSTDIDGAFDGAVELANLMTGSDTVRECVTRQWFRFAFARAEAEADTCALEEVDEAFAASGHDVREMIKALVLSDAFRNRRAEKISNLLPGEEDKR